MHAYSELFTLIYETHHPYTDWVEDREPCVSIFSTVQWKGERLEPLKQAMIQRFAVIWDLDHDDRIILALNRAYVMGLLSPVAAIGKSKGRLAIILHEFAPRHSSEHFYESWKVVASCVDGDEWDVMFGEIGCTACCIIFDDDEAATFYIDTLRDKFNLGIYPFVNRHSEQSLDPDRVCKPPSSRDEKPSGEHTRENENYDLFDDDVDF